MDMVFDVLALMLLVGFPVGLLLGTLDEYSTRFSPRVVRRPGPVPQPTPVHRVHVRWHRLALRTRLRPAPLARNEANLRTHPVADSEHIGADAA